MKEYPKVLLLDFGEVWAVREDGSNIDDHLIKDIAYHFGVSEKEVKEGFNEDVIHPFQRGEIGHEEVWKRFEDNISIHDKEIPDESIWTDHFNYPNTLLHFNDGIVKIARKAEKRGALLGILSNTIKYHADFFYKSGLYMGFPKEMTFLSNEVGTRKPEAEIYLIAMAGSTGYGRKMGYFKENILAKDFFFVDDSESHVEAAEKLGMNAFNYVKTDPTADSRLEQAVDAWLKGL